MADLFDYLAWRGDLAFEAVPLCDVDRVILAELSYLDFAGIIPDFGGEIPLSEACLAVMAEDEAGTGKRELFHMSDDRRLVKVLSASPRFAALRLTGYRSLFDPDRQEQFAAMTVLHGDGSAICVFRGTDWSLIGWKEDFNLAFSDTIPSQMDALDYIRDLAAHHLGPIRVLGHSKGGHLALFAAAFGGVSERIIEAVSLDGPGFGAKVLESDAFQKIRPITRTLVPKSSVVGILFEHSDPFTVVDSRAPGGLLQHNLYSWKCMAGELVTVTRLDGQSQLLEGAMNEWIASLEPSVREKVIEGIWSVLGSADMTELGDILDGRNTLTMIRAYAAMDEDTRRLIGEAMGRLRDCAKGRLIDMTKNRK